MEQEGQGEGKSEPAAAFRLAGGKGGPGSPAVANPPLPLTTAAVIAVVVSRFARQERFEVVFGDQPAASCLYRPELAGAQQVVDEFSGDAQ